MTIKALIFDCDGTLADTMPAHFHAWQAALAEHGIEFTEERFYALAGQPTPKIVRLLAKEQGVALDHGAVTRAKEDAYLKQIETVRPIEPVLKIAKQARGQLKLAVASGAVRRVLERTLAHVGITDWFEAIVSADCVKRHKPEPDVFLEAARRLGVPAAACRVYEDGDLGIEAARRAGMECVDIRPML